MVGVRVWSSAAPFVVGGMIAIALSLVAVTLFVPAWRGADGMAIPGALVALVVLALTVLLQPQMGRREFIRRYGSLPQYFAAYFRQRPVWVFVAHVGLVAAGIVSIGLSWATVSPRSTLVSRDGAEFLQSATSAKALDGSSYAVAASALHVWDPLGGLVTFLSLLLIFSCADHYLGSRPELWPQARAGNSSSWPRLTRRRR